MREPWAVRAGRREAAFYDFARRVPNHAPVLARVFDTAFDASSGESHVLLLDVSDTHEVALSRDLLLTPGRNVPPDEALFGCVDALARLRGFWWNHSLLGGDAIERPGWCGSPDTLKREVERRRSAFALLRDEEGETVGPRLLRLYEWVFARSLSMWTTRLLPRWNGGEHLTFAHGDAYPANFFVPRESGETLVIDWQSPEAWIGAWDLVTLCATFWTREQRAHEDRERRA